MPLHQVWSHDDGRTWPTHAAISDQRGFNDTAAQRKKPGFLNKPGFGTRYDTRSRSQFHHHVLPACGVTCVRTDFNCGLTTLLLATSQDSICTPPEAVIT